MHAPASHADSPWRALVHDLCGFIAGAYEPAQAPLSVWPASRVTRPAFLDMARRVVQHQAARNPAYARYAERLGVDLDRLADPLDAPPVPTDAFKRLRLCAFEPAEAVACFRSSGTTAADRGQHLFRTLDVYRASIAPSFAQYVLPDLGPDPRIHMLVLAPSAAQVPDSSLYFMLDFLCQRFGRDRARTHFFDQPPGDHLALDVAALCRALEALAAQDEPVLLLGPSFSYVHLFDQAPDFRVTLPPRSRLFETGGFKGKSREVGRDELHALFRERLGIEPAMVVGEYSMSELSSQLYEPGLRRTLAGNRGREAGHVDGTRLYVPTPWCAVRILDPATLAPLAPGQPGLVAFFDLANVDSVAAVVTGDMGTLVPSMQPGDAPPGWHGLPEGSRGLVLHGRAAGQSAKGCSLAIDMLLQP
jgi:Acyl-protein synthetase, LuxE